ncbi:MAG: DUF4440 domain-containing protein [Gammaproteobacteria bacterium]|jgi:hypothetical protein|nr:DUF4440 domain-containing protein [Gammaproteobacteria bacterium]
MNRFIKVLLLGFSVLLVQPAAASDVEDLTDLLQDFLANSGKEAAHERFWADDLVYSSSAGLRFGKADIMSGFDSTSDEENDAPPEIVYSGEDVDVRLYGDTAVVAFKLVGTPTNEGAGASVMYYYNTGTFLKRDGIWKAVAWQATKIPPNE